MVPVQVKAAYRVVIAVGDPLQVVDPVDLITDGGEGLGDSGEDGFAAAMRSVGEPVDGIGSDQRDKPGEVVAVGGLLVDADELSERGSGFRHGLVLFFLSRRDKWQGALDEASDDDAAYDDAYEGVCPGLYRAGLRSCA